MKCLIIDDEPLAVKLLVDYASQTPGLEVVMAGSDVFEGLKIAQNAGVDLVFLDIQMPELSGIQFMKVLNGKCKVILTTAYEEYALQAFDHDVVDYLLKPFSLERFETAIQKARGRLNISRPAGESVRTSYIFVRSEYRLLKIELTDILYLESLRDYVAIHTTEGKIMTLQSLRSFEELLDQHRFMRIHKSYIIAIDKIGSVERKRVVIGKTYLPVGETYLEAFWKKLNIHD